MDKHGPSTSPAHSFREQVLDAAQGVILEQGIGTLTLDKVASRAGVSKGGLLHHFPSKDALLDAIVRRVVDDWQADVDESIAAEEPGPMRVPRAILRGCISQPDEWTETLRAASICVIAAMSEHRRHVTPIRAVYASMESRMVADKTPAGLAQLVLCASDGLWMSFVFGTRAFSRERLRDFAQCLKEVIAMHEGRRATSGMARPASKTLAGVAPKRRLSPRAAAATRSTGATRPSRPAQRKTKSRS